MDENDKVLLEGEEEIVEPTEVADGEEDSTDYKALALKNAGIAKRLKTKLEKAKLDKKVDAKVEKVLSEKTGFDYAEKSYLVASGVSRDDFDYLFNVAQDTGKDLDSLLESKFVQAELKDRKEARATKEATPSGSKRSGQASRDTVDYWIAKGELPPADQIKLRREVVNAKIDIAKQKSQFSDNPIV